MITLDPTKLTLEDIEVIEGYTCANTIFKYEEFQKFDKIGEEAYDVEVDFFFKCEMLHFVDDKVRIRYYSDFNNPIRGEFKNTSSDFNKTGDIPFEVSIGKKVRLDTASNFEQFFKFEYDKKLFGLDTFQAMIHNDYDNEADLEKYNNYNFSDFHNWNDFWFAAETNILLQS